jgi:hypothetical protein
MYRLQHNKTIVEANDYSYDKAMATDTLASNSFPKEKKGKQHYKNTDI